MKYMKILLVITLLSIVAYVPSPVGIDSFSLDGLAQLGYPTVQQAMVMDIFTNELLHIMCLLMLMHVIQIYRTMFMISIVYLKSFIPILKKWEVLFPIKFGTLPFDRHSFA